MTLLLDSDDIAQVLSPELCLRALRPMFEDLADGSAANMLGREVVLSASTQPGTADFGGATPYHGLEVQTGSVSRTRTASLRLKSDILYWPEVDGAHRRKKYPGAPGGQYCGLIIIFDTDTGAPTAIMPDGLLQRMRVGATSALGAQYLAKQDARTGAVLGSGAQAEAQVLCLEDVLQLEEIRVYSPKPESRRALVSALADRVSARIVPVDTAEDAVRGAEVVHAATNSRSAVLKAEWLEPGAHVSNICLQEIGEDVIAAASLVTTTAPHATHLMSMAFAGASAEDVHEAEFDRGWWQNQGHWDRMVLIGDIIAGRHPGRQGARDITVFVNDGAYTQFAAVGAAIIEAALAEGLGRDLPTDWFLQPYAP